MKTAIAVLVLLLLSTFALAAVQSQAVEYKHEDATMTGCLSWNDAAQGARPGVSVIHEWYGCNDYAKEACADAGVLRRDLLSTGCATQSC